MAAKTVLIIDDSLMMRNLIGNIIDSDPDLQVIGDAANGEEGLRKVSELTPDVVMLDIEMPIMDGLEFLNRLPAISNTKVVVLSVDVKATSDTSIKALEMGAVETLAKPSGAVSLDLKKKSSHTIITAVRRAAGLGISG